MLPLPGRVVAAGAALTPRRQAMKGLVGHPTLAAEGGGAPAASVELPQQPGLVLVGVTCP